MNDIFIGGNKASKNIPSGDNGWLYIQRLVRCMVAAGYSIKACSTGTGGVKDTTGNDLWACTTGDFIDGTLPTLGNAAWIVLKGPSTAVIPIGTALPTGMFLAGEVVVGSVSGARGIVEGVNINPTGVQMASLGTLYGYMVVSPISGTFQNDEVVTGQRSGAFIPIIDIPRNYTREFVFWHGAGSYNGSIWGAGGHIYYECLWDDLVNGEGTQLFSELAKTASCTVTIAPGGSTTGENGFPASQGCIAIHGTGGSGAANTGSKFWPIAGWSQFNSDERAYPTQYNSHILVANAVAGYGGNDVAADGSWTLALGMRASCMVCIGFQRLDDIEPGEIDPYIVCDPNANNGLYDGTCTRLHNKGWINGEPSNGSGWDFGRDNGGNISAECMGAQKVTPFIGTKARGLLAEGFDEFVGLSEFYYFQYDAAHPFYGENASSTDKVVTAPIPTRARKPIWVASFRAGCKWRKGTLRWWCMMPNSSYLLTYDYKQWISMSGASAYCLVIGPWDGVTNPVAS